MYKKKHTASRDVQGDIQTAERGRNMEPSHPSRLGSEVSPSWPQAHLQQRWKTLSGLPSDSDFTWTISHTAFASASRQIRTRMN